MLATTTTKWADDDDDEVRRDDDEEFFTATRSRALAELTLRPIDLNGARTRRRKNCLSLRNYIVRNSQKCQR